MKDLGMLSEVLMVVQIVANKDHMPAVSGKSGVIGQSSLLCAKSHEGPFKL